MTDLATIENKLSDLGLNPATVTKHQNALTRLVSSSGKKYFDIIDTCRIDNGGILQLKPCLDTLISTEQRPATFAAFIPAAGAASRYIRPLADLEAALENNDVEASIVAIKALHSQGAAMWPLPKILAALVIEPESFRSLDKTQIEELKIETSLPKALMPCVIEGVSFLEIKMREHRQIRELSKEFFVIPPKQSSEFQTAITSVKSDLKDLPCEVLEQHAGLSTIRFNQDGSPYLDASSNPSMVPAGHGTLTQLFPLCSGKARSLFIRNIDNIMGTSNEILKTTSDFLSVHDKILTLVSTIRAAIDTNDLTSAESAAAVLLKLCDKGARVSLPPGLPENLKTLWQVQVQLFHSAIPSEPTLKDLKRLYQRPVNTLGQVPNTGKDIGGTPCFVSYKGKTIKICVEVPHASPVDRQRFFANPEKATHFNPVFAAAEVTTDPGFYQRENDDFWLMAEKTFKGTNVIYYETVLYELIGNSALANVVFVEVPRTVFNPHKTMEDASASSIKRWLA